MALEWLDQIPTMSCMYSCCGMDPKFPITNRMMALTFNICTTMAVVVTILLTILQPQGLIVWVFYGLLIFIQGMIQFAILVCVLMCMKNKCCSSNPCCAFFGYLMLTNVCLQVLIGLGLLVISLLFVTFTGVAAQSILSNAGGGVESAGGLIMFYIA